MVCLGGEDAKKMRIGILGGTFDPIHFGHLLLAEIGMGSLALDRVIFLPAGIPPHKKDWRITSGERRAAMIEAAIGDNEAFALCRWEIDSSDMSFTARTLARFHAESPGDEFFFLVGSETLADIPTWYHPEEVCRLAILATAVRPNAPPPDFSKLQRLVSPERLEQFRTMILPMPLIDISSTEIRNRTRNNQSIRYMTPDVVRELIALHRLYRD